MGKTRQSSKDVLLRWSLWVIVTVSVVCPHKVFCVCVEAKCSVPGKICLMFEKPWSSHEVRFSFEDGNFHLCHRYCPTCCTNQTDLATLKVVHGLSLKRFDNPLSVVADVQTMAVAPSVVDRSWSLPFVPLLGRDLNLLYCSLRI